MSVQNGNVTPPINPKQLVHEFRKLKVPAFLPGEREYELSCATANLLYRFTRPHLVVQPENWAEVLIIVERAYELELYGMLTVKCGGHSYTGFSTVDQGIVVDLKRMTEAHVEFKDGKPDIAVIQAGARWGDVYRTLIRSDCVGYVVNGGRCPSVGVSGFILGGGLSPFGRTIGMGSDTLVSATIITVKDKKVQKLEVTHESDPDLFWALKGGGTAAFGIVTEFKLKVIKLKNPKPEYGVTACRYTWVPDQKWKALKPGAERIAEEAAFSKRVTDTMNRFYEAKWPNEMTIDSNWMMDMNGDYGKLGIRFTLYYDGPEADCDQYLEDNIIDEELKTNLQKRTIPEPTTRFLHETLFLMWEEEARLALPRMGENSYQLWCSFVFTGNADVMEKVIQAGKEEQEIFEKNFAHDNASMWVTYIHSGGQVADKKLSEDSAYPWRQGVFHCSVMIKWGEKWLEAHAREAILRIKKRLSVYSVKYDDKQCASYVNFSDATLAVRGDALTAYYGDNGARLADLKEKRDPNGLFKWPWATDTQKWRDWEDKEKAPEPTGEVRVMSAKMSAKRVSAKSDAVLAKEWTDSIAGDDWTSYKVPPPSYTELYAPPYLSVDSI